MIYFLTAKSNSHEQQNSPEFHIALEDQQAALSLMRLALSKLEQLEEAGIEVEYFELRSQLLSQPQKNKRIYIKVDSYNESFMDAEVSAGWKDAFLRTFEKIYSRFVPSHPIVKESLLFLN
jgi:hypothetical protein